MEMLGRFALARRIGAGSSGVVYAAHDLEDGGRAIALKRLVRVDAEGIFRLKSEFRALTDLVHPNLVRLHELIELGGQWWVTMELVDGEDFLAWARPGGALDEGRLGHALTQLGAGLGALHAAGRLHRDLKPSNVRVTPDGRVVILDFGLALAGAGREAPGGGEVAGTPAYMSPEQARGRRLSPATDAYAVGVMWFEALYGRLPFEGSALEQLLARIKGPPSLPPAPGVSAQLVEGCAALLEPDPARRPSLSRALVVAGLGAAGVVARAPVPLVGRTAELSALDVALVDARSKAVAIDVAGPSGSGKTTLVEAFLERAERAGARILRGRCYERAHVPYEAVDAVIDALGGELAGRALVPGPDDDGPALARVFPALAKVWPLLPERGVDDDGAAVRARAFAALRALLRRLADERALVVFIDDLQWGDVDGAELLGALIRPPDAPRMLLVTGYRDDEADASACVGAWREARVPADARHLEVGPLLPEEARALARALLPDHHGRADALAQDSAGSPFLLTELARARPSSVPAGSIDAAVRARAAELPADARALLEALAVARGPLEQGVAARVAGALDGPGAVDRLRFEHLARTRGHGTRTAVETYHDRVRVAVEAGLSVERRRALHQALAEALEAAGAASPERLAEHFAAAGERGRAAEYAVRAAEAASAALAFDQAARSYALALDLLGIDDLRRVELEVGRGEALASAGRGAEAAQAFLRAAATQSQRGGGEVGAALELRRRAAEQLLACGHVDEGLDTIGPVLAHTGLSLPATRRGALLSWLIGRARLRLRGLRPGPELERGLVSADADRTLRADVCWTLTLGLNAVDMLRSADFATRALMASLDGGDRRRAGRALAYEAAISAFLGGRARADEALAVLAELEPGDAYLQALHHLVAGLLEAFTSGHWAAALAHYARAESGLSAPHPGAVRDRATLAMVTLWSLYYRGELDEIRRRVPALSASARERRDLYAETTLTNASAWSLLAADRPLEARADVARRAAAWTARGFHLQHYVALLAHTHVDRYLGDGASAWRRWRQAERELARSQLLRVRNNAWVARYERGALAVMVLDRPGARAAAASDARALQRSGVAWAVPFADLIRAGVARVDGEIDTALQLLERAAAGHAAADMPLYAAAARWVRADLAGHARARDAARGEMEGRGVVSAERWARMLVP